MSRLHRSKDDLMSSSDPEAVALWEGIVDARNNEVASWTQRLRAMGVKLAHPDDGWVRRDAPEPYLSLSWYPQFNDDPQEGDYMALGWPSGHYRLVRVTRVEQRWGLTHYYYKDADLRVPPAPPSPGLRRWLRRFLPWARKDPHA